MEPIGTIQGLASGIDFRALVDAIIQAEAQPAVLLSRRKEDLDTKTTAWGDVQLRLTSAFDRSKELADPLFFKKFNTEVSGAEGTVSVSASSSAVPGSFAVEVLRLATHEKVSSDVHQDRDAALGLTGEFVVGGQAVQVAAGDSLDDLAQAINAAASRATSGAASATVVGASGGGYRVVVTAAESGAAGVQLADGSAGLLRTLGFVDQTTATKHQTSDGATSDGFKSASADIATLLGLTAGSGPSTVTIGSRTVDIDFDNDSLEDIAAAINAAAAGPGPSTSISAQIVTEIDASGNTLRRLDISGTTSFVDADGVLETLGVLEAGRGAVAQQVRGATFTDDDDTTLATGSTRFRDIWINGADADVSNGDTLTISGTHGDGTTFSKTISVNGGDRLSELVDELNSGTDGFGVGSRTATAAIVDGAIVVTDDTGGTSQLSLSIVSNNEGGGALDFATFDTVAAGREREVTAGVDSQVLIDGASHERSSNTLTDVVEGVTLTLDAVSGSGPATVDVSVDVEGIAEGVEAFVKSFNAISEFVLSQFTGIGAEEGESKRPLSGDRVVRQVRDQMRAALQTAISSGVSNFASLNELGIEANSEGTYDIDSAALREAIESDPIGVERMFSAFGAGSVSSLEYVSAGTEADTGAYDVFVSTAAARAAITGTGFGGTYSDDGTADILTITDSSTASAYAVSLSDGMTLTQIVDALNDQFATATARELNAIDVMKSDAGGTDADESTLLQDLHSSAGTNFGVANGDRFTFSGTRADGTSFFREWTATDVSTQSLGTLRAEVAAAVGSDVVIDVENGVLTASAIEDGGNPFTLTVASDNAGGGSFTLGGFDVVEEGRGAARISASDSGGELAIEHEDYGSVDGFTVAFAPGGSDGSASLGVAAANYLGVDVSGTIGGHAATGQGRLLTGDEGSEVEGLVIEYSGTDPGSVGSLTFSRGIASLMETITDGYLDGGETSIQGIVERLDTQKRRIDERVERLEERLAIRETNLIRRFTALEEALAQMQQESAWLQAQLGGLLGPSQQVGRHRR